MSVKSNSVDTDTEGECPFFPPGAKQTVRNNEVSVLVGVPKAGFDYTTFDFLLVAKRTAKMCHTVRCGILTF